MVKVNRVRVETAADLSRHLSEVKSVVKGEYQYTAAPPCHQCSEAHQHSFYFGAGADGLLKLICFGCLQREDYYSWLIRLEDILGVSLRHGGNGRRFAGRTKTLPAKPLPPPKQLLEPLDCTALEAVSFRDLPLLEAWFVADLKRGATYRGMAWRQSIDARKWRFQVAGGWRRPTPADARFGGLIQGIASDNLGRELQVQPWQPWSLVQELISRTPQLRRPEIGPTLGFAGTQEHACPHEVLCIDFDYKPGMDVSGKGIRYREAFIICCLSAGMPLYSSTSGNGFHAMGRVHPDTLAQWTVNGVTKRRSAVEPFGKGSKEQTGVGVDLFLPGTPHLVKVRLQDPAGNNEPGRPLPLLRPGDVGFLLKLKQLSEG